MAQSAANLHLTREGATTPTTFLDGLGHPSLGTGRQPSPVFWRCILEVWPAPGARESLQKGGGGGAKPSHFLTFSRAPGAGQTSKTHPKNQARVLSGTQSIKSVGPAALMRTASDTDSTGHVQGRLGRPLAPLPHTLRSLASCCGPASQGFAGRCWQLRLASLGGQFDEDRKNH